MIESVQHNAGLAITGCIRGKSRDRITDYVNLIMGTIEDLLSFIKYK